MEICLVRDYTPPAQDWMGAERVVEDLARFYQSNGHKVYLASYTPKSSIDIPVVKKIPDTCDIIHYHGWSDFHAVTKNKPYVVTIHGGGSSENEPWVPLYKNDERIICISRYVADHLGMKTVIYNCIDPKKFIFKEKKDDYFLWLGGTDWGESKGLFSCIEYAKKLNFNLKIAGTGSNDKIIERVKQVSDQNKNIEYVGPVNGIEKAEILSNAKAVLNIGHVPDAFCLVNVEAALSGTPAIVAKNIGAHEEILGNNAIFIEHRNFPEFAKALVKINKIDKKNCRQRAIDKYSIDTIGKQHLDFYRNVIENYGNKKYM